MTCTFRAIVVCCATSLALPVSARAQAPSEPEVQTSRSLTEAEALYKKGRSSFETANYLEAIDLWEEAYGLVEDVPENAAIKAALIYNIASAQEQAYDIDTDITHLRRAAVLLETYAKSVPALYGDSPEGAAEMEKVEVRLAELRARIEEAESAREVPEPEAPPPEDAQPEPTDAPVDRGKPLVIAGAVTAGLGVVGLGVMAGGLAMGSAANDVDETQSLEDRRSQFDRGRTGNALAYAGGIAGGVLIVTGGVLLGLGLKKRSAGAMALAPWGGRRGAGLRLSGRF